MLRHYFLRRHTQGQAYGVVEAGYWYELMVSESEFPLGIPTEKSICVLHSEVTGRILVNRLNSERKDGLIEGITRFAWWKDGEQYVGTCGTVLKQALNDATHESSTST